MIDSRAALEPRARRHCAVFCRPSAVFHVRGFDPEMGVLVTYIRKSGTRYGAALASWSEIESWVVSSWREPASRRAG